jgi:pimeloyl-ACP methyl ester carboxylesterase
MIAGDRMWGETPTALVSEGHGVIMFRDPIGVVTGSIDDMTDHVERDLDHRAPGTFVLVGASLGAAVALEYIARHPDRVSALVLSGAPTGVGNAQLGISSFGKLTRGVADAAADRLFHDRSRLPHGMVEETFRTFLDKRRFLNIARLMRASETYDSATPLARVNVDTLMIWGEQDRVSRCEDWKRFVPLAKRGTFITIPDCGHSPMLEQPGLFNRALLTFLADSARQSSAT